MIPAFARFKGHSTHGQPVETKEGGWKENTDKQLYNLITIAKGASLLFIGGAILGAVMATPVLGQLAGAGILAYAFTAHMQGYARSVAENEKKNPNSISDEPPRGQVIKNSLRYLVQPF